MQKQDAEDILIRITVCNRGPEAAQLQCCRIYGFETPGTIRKRRNSYADCDATASARQLWRKPATTTSATGYFIAMATCPAVHEQRDERARFFQQANSRPT